MHPCMAVLADTHVFWEFLSKNNSSCKNSLLVPEDIAIISSKSDFDCCRDFQVIKATEYMWMDEHVHWHDTRRKEGIISHYSAYGLPIKMNGFFIECWFFYSMTEWTKLERSYKALQIYAWQNGIKNEQQQPPSSILVPNWEVSQIYKNKLAHTRDHSYHTNQV